MNIKRINKLLMALMLLGASVAGVSCSKEAEVTLQTVTVAQGDVCESVTATGTLESVNQVDVGTQVTGIVSKLYADFNSQVKAGQVIAEIDKTTLESDLKSANANKESARLTFEYTQKNYNRDKALHDKQLISDYEFETTRKDYLVAKANYEKSQADCVRAAKNLSYAEIYSPIDGIVISREVEVGQTVVSSMSVANLFVIADLDKMRVVANVDEADIGSVKEGQNASFTVDAYPNDVFEGKVLQVRISPTTTSNVVTYEVLIDAPNPDHKLIPGLTANITIKTMEAIDVMTVPLKALRFQPQEFEKGGENLPKAEAMPKAPSNAPEPTEGKEPADPAIPTDDNHRLVWVVRDNKLIPTEIEIGADNGVDMQVTSGLKAGDVIAIGYEQQSQMTDGEAAQSGNSSPFAPTPPGGNKKK